MKMVGNIEMQRLIPLVNKLQDCVTTSDCNLELDLPQIVVVGAQSAGKSSVLESFVGRDFLPRGSGIITRRPLILKLVTAVEEYAEFLHLPGVRFYDFDKVREEIVKETDHESGRNKGISSKPINLTIFSPSVLNLTLVDLPGLTKVSIGDQPTDIEFQIRQMIVGFICKKNCLILAVTPANCDLANSDALKLAKEFDPTGLRTIGVITKLDLMDEGTDARQILENKLLPLARGYVGVVNRSQKDINGKKDISAAVKKEKEFFSNHHAYKHIAHKCGINFLQKTLSKELANHIQSVLPEIKSNLQSKVEEIESSVKMYEQMENNGTEFRIKLMLQYVQNLVDQFMLQIEGLGAGIQQSKLCHGAVINAIFKSTFRKSLKKVYSGVTSFLKGEGDSLNTNNQSLHRLIVLAIRNMHSIKPGIFTPNRVFESLVQMQIVKFIEPSLECVHLVVEQLKKAIQECISQIGMDYFPALRDETDLLIQTFLSKQHIETNENLIFYIKQVQYGYVHTNRKNFVKSVRFELKENVLRKSEEMMERRDEIIHPVQMADKNENFDFEEGEGFVTIHGQKIHELYAVLHNKNLVLYKDKRVNKSLEIKSIPLENCRIQDYSDENIYYGFHIYNPNKAQQSVLKMCVASQSEFEGWLRAFSSNDIIHDTKIMEHNISSNQKKKPTALLSNKEFEISEDEQEKIPLITALVGKYMELQNKWIQGHVPKTCVYFLLNGLKKFLKNDLLIQLLAADKEFDLMEESPLERERRQELINRYKNLTQALSVVAEINFKTQPSSLRSTDDNSWMTRQNQNDYINHYY